MSGEPVRRRDLLTTAAFAMAGGGGLVALWPFVAAMNPAADAVARRVTFDTRGLIGGAQVTLAVENLPIAIFRRTEEELAWLRDPPMPNKTYDSYSGHAFRDRDSDEPRQPAWAKNWHRSRRPEIMICEAICTHLGCVVHARIYEFDTIGCSCCGSRYDLAGRVFSGPAMRNLRVPPYRFVDATTIEFTVSDVSAMRTSRASPA